MKLGASLLMGTSWIFLWTQDTFWNPVLFTSMWTGATLLIYGFGSFGYPGWRTHMFLGFFSMPVWWWFELVNTRVRNWEYVYSQDYNSVEYVLFSSVAFATVVPALHATWRLTGRILLPAYPDLIVRRLSIHLIEIFLGLITSVMVFVFPDILFPLVWIGSFLLIDGVVGYRGEGSLLIEMARGNWHLTVSIGMAGLLCGFLWEFWNYWATPKWIYHIRYVDFLHVFEMPLLGYGGYFWFAWSVYQLLQLGWLRRVLKSFVSSQSRYKTIGVE